MAVIRSIWGLNGGRLTASSEEILRYRVGSVGSVDEGLMNELCVGDVKSGLDEILLRVFKSFFVKLAQGLGPEGPSVSVMGSQCQVPEKSLSTTSRIIVIMDPEQPPDYARWKRSAVREVNDDH